MFITKRTFPGPGVRVADPEVFPSTPSEPLAIPPLGRGQNRPQFPWMNPALAAARDFANRRLPLADSLLQIRRPGDRAGVIAGDQRLRKPSPWALMVSRARTRSPVAVGWKSRTIDPPEYATGKLIYPYEEAKR
jgi:hypothetical protein